MKVIDVTWVDSSMHGGRVWHGMADIQAGTLVAIRSVGFLVHEDKASLTVAAHLGDSDEVAGAMKIPKAAVVKRRVVKMGAL